MPRPTDREALLWAVLCDPADDLARLAYADACEEAEDCDRAEFVRVQVALAKYPPLRPATLSATTSYAAGLEAEREDDPARERLQRRELEIVDRMPGFLCLPGESIDDYGWDGSGATIIEYDSGSEATFSRGFVQAIRLPLAEFTDDTARALFLAHPITAVTLSDKVVHSYHNNGEPELWGWADQSRVSSDPAETRLPSHLWNIVAADRRCVVNGVWADFSSRNDANDALSRACVTWARGLAGLPDIPLVK